MSKIISLNGAQNVVNQQLKQNTAKLLFEITTAPDAGNLTKSGSEIFTEIMTALEDVNVKVDLQKKDGQGSFSLIPEKMNLAEVAEAYSNSVHDGRFEADTKANGAIRALFTVEIGLDGSLSMTDQDTLIVNVEGMSANQTLNVFAMDFPVITQTAIKSTAIRFDQDTEQGVTLTGAYVLAIPKADFQKIQIFYPNGKVWELNSTEMESVIKEGNGVQAIIDGIAFTGGYKFYLMNVADAVSAKLTMSNDTNCYLLSPVVK